MLAEAADAYRKAFGPRLLAAYALGSLAHGGFSPLVSDVDASPPELHLGWHRRPTVAPEPSDG